MKFPPASHNLLSRFHLSSIHKRTVLAVLSLLSIVILCFAGAFIKFNHPLGETQITFSSPDGPEIIDSEIADSTESTTQVQRSIVVQVSGCVINPGVYEVPENSRVIDAVEMAGGLTEEADEAGCNLARILVDGEQIIIPLAPEFCDEETMSSSGIKPGGTGTGKVNINHATEEDLRSLNGIGPSLAARIVSDREANGPFASIDDLQRVSGIGPKKYEGLKEEITI